MENSKEFKLVKGVFSPEKAKEVLFKLINSKIKFHQLEKFSLEERNEGNSKDSNERIHQLESSKAAIEKQLILAQKENKSIKIEGSIVLEFIDTI